MQDRKKSPIYVMSDDEMDTMMSDNKKSELMDSLINAVSQKTTRFSAVRRKKQPTEDTSDLNRLKPSSDNLENDLVSLEEINLSDKSVSLLSDGDWDDMMDRFDELSPIDDITYEDRMNYRRKQTGDKFDQMFNKEQSMLNDLLAGLQKRSKLIDKKIDASLSGRGAYSGVTKNLADLLNASNSVESTKLNVIKELIGVKKTAVDFRMKDQKMNPDDNMEEDRDTIADRFYKSIISGNSRDFIKSSMAQYDTQDQFNGFNLSQPSSFTNNPDLDTSDADKYGYIKYENVNAQVCICRYEDGSMEFVALDEDNNVIPGYELPSNNLIVNISIKPGSQYGYDEYARKYRVFDAEEINFNTSDNRYDEYSSPELDDEPYDDATNDDKYDMDDDVDDEPDYYDEELV